MSHAQQSAILSGLFNLKYVRSLPHPKQRTYIIDADSHTLPCNDKQFDIHAALRIPYTEASVDYPTDGKDAAAFITARVVKAMPNTETLSDARPADDYTLTGDFIDIVSVPGKKHRAAKTKLHAPMLDIIGQVKSVNRSKFSFDVDVSQYTYANPKGVLPVTGIIMKDSRWHNDRTKALPTIGSIVHFMGHLRGLTSSAAASVDAGQDDAATGSHPDDSDDSSDSDDDDSEDDDGRFVVEITRVLDFITRGPPPTPSVGASSSVAGSQPNTPTKSSTLRFKRALTESPSMSAKAAGKRRAPHPDDSSAASTSTLSTAPVQSAKEGPETREAAKRRKIAQDGDGK